MSAPDDSAEVTTHPEPDSALLVAARQLSEEAWLRPRLAGLTGLRRRAAATRSRRNAQRRVVLPEA